MKLKELNLISFGKFENKIFKLEDGLNIFYGKNESGKTTIHNFIDGMFYGFLKPYATRRYYLDEYEKYRPWYNEQYSGILRLSKEEKFYRIERDFGKGKVKVYDDVTGRDITKDIDTGERIKIHLPGMYFFDFNNLVYKNTISIKQLGNKIESNLSKEVKDRLANISTSLDDNISVKNALADLEKQLDNIGTERAYTKPYGRAKARLNKFLDRHKQALEKQIEYNKYIHESNALQERLVDYEKELKELKGELTKISLWEKKKIYQDALYIKEQLERIDLKIEKLKEYSHLSFDDYTKAFELQSNNNHLCKEINGLKESLNYTEERLEKAKLEYKEGIVEGIKVEELYEDIHIYDEMEDEKNAITMNNQQNKLEILKSEMKDKLDKHKKSKIAIGFLLLLIVASVGLGIINFLLMLLSIPLGGLALYIYISMKKLTKEMGDLELRIKEIEYVQNENNERISYINRIQKDILLKYDCLSKSEIKRLYDDIHFNHMNQVNMGNKIKELTKEKDEAIAKLEIKTKESQRLLKDINTILFKNNSKTLEEFKEGLDKKRNYDDLIKDKDSKLQVLGKTLSNNSLEELKKELADYNDGYFRYIQDINKEKIIDEINIKEEALYNLNESNARLEERIDNLSKEVKQLVLIEEEINRLNNLINSYKNKIKSIEIAKETIEGISKNIHNQFAPTINKDISQIIKAITDGRYDQVRVQDDLGIVVENPITKEIIDIDNLSGGTIDQLYFALRFSIISSINRDNLPLILDDCFIQYDDNRLNNIIKFLNYISNKKQILLFTCHYREKEILDNLGLKYNLINIS